MRLQIASDLHHEFIAPGRPGSEPIALADGVDVLVLAAISIHTRMRAICTVTIPYLLIVDRYRADFATV